MEKRFISVKELSECLGLSVKTIRSWVFKRNIPYHKLGGAVRFDLRELDKWFADQRIENIT
ncbi:helix-turn-helix domain-containing protein [Candidatus Omnitrophota bacterium]